MIKNFTEIALRFKNLPTWKTLTASQKEFCEIFFSKQDSGVFLTGSAGTGKSFVAKLLIDFLVAQRVAVAKTASTGVAALLIGGSTLHSFMGIGLAQEDAETLARKVRKNKRAVERILNMELLVIDEISMIKGDLLDKVDKVCRAIRWKYRDKPFGGCKLLVVGDLMQLMPIWRGSNEERILCFEAQSWSEANVQTVELTEIVRQENDPEFAKLLGRLRFGETDDMQILANRIDAKFPNDGIEPVRIFCKNVDVDAYNRNRLNQISEKSYHFYADDFGTEQKIEQLNKHCAAKKDLELKVGATVRLLQNVDVEGGFVNGSVGVVCQFTPNGIMVKFKNGKLLVEKTTWEIKEAEVQLGGGFKYRTVASRKQYPLKLSWAVTAHSIQGSTLDRAIIDMGEAFAEGMVYVALSRVRSLDALSIVDCPVHRVKVNQECLAFYRNLRK